MKHEHEQILQPLQHEVAGQLPAQAVAGLEQVLRIVLEADSRDATDEVAVLGVVWDRSRHGMPGVTVGMGPHRATTNQDGAYSLRLPRTLVMAGGVSANLNLRARLERVLSKERAKVSSCC